MEQWCKAALILAVMYSFAGCAVKPSPQANVGSDAWIYVTGEVNNPGRIPATNEAGITLLQALHQAGGFTEQAYVKRISVMQPGKTNEFNFRLIERGEQVDPLVPAGSTVHVRYRPF
jgi:protein involved in polysaccharide export with SLBB domain